MTEDELKYALKNHKEWLEEKGGQRAYFTDTDLSEANLEWADLSGAILLRANLADALPGVDLLDTF